MASASKPPGCLTTSPLTLAFVGGTGPEGSGLALRLAAAGHRVIVGSRSEERAREAARTLAERLEGAGVRGGPVGAMQNETAVEEADVVFLCLPYGALGDFLARTGTLLARRIVVDVVVPLRFDNGHVDLLAVPDRSASAEIARRVPEARVVAGFKNLSAVHLLALGEPVEGDVLLAGDDAGAKAVVADLARDIPHLRPVDAGGLVNAAFLESLTALEINMNRLHKARTSVRILGLRE